MTTQAQSETVRREIVVEAPVDHETRLLEDLQVLGHRGAADGKLVRELADRTRPLRETLEHRPPRRVAQRGPRINSVSNH